MSDLLLKAGSQYFCKRCSALAYTARVDIYSDTEKTGGCVYIGSSATSPVGGDKIECCSCGHFIGENVFIIRDWACREL